MDSPCPPTIPTRTLMASSLYSSYYAYPYPHGILNAGSGCCTVAMMYHRTVWKQLVAEFALHWSRPTRADTSGAPEPRPALPPYWVNYSSQKRLYRAKIDGNCPTDLYLGNAVKARRIAATTLGVVQHPSLPSEIGVRLARDEP